MATISSSSFCVCFSLLSFSKRDLLKQFLGEGGATLITMSVNNVPGEAESVMLAFEMVETFISVGVEIKATVSVWAWLTLCLNLDVYTLLCPSLLKDISQGTTKALGCSVTPAAAAKIAGAVKSLAAQSGGVEALAQQGALAPVSVFVDCVYLYYWGWYSGRNMT